MIRRNGIIVFLVMLLVAGLLFAGCGDTNGTGENGNGDPNGNGDVNGDENGNGGIDLSDPEKVLEGFLAAFAALDSQKASPYLTASARVDFNNWVGELEENPYYYDLTKFVLQSISVEITDHDIEGDQAAVHFVASMPDFDKGELYLTEEQQEAFLAVIVVLAAKGVHLGGEDMGMRPDPGIDLDEAWAVAFGMMPDIVAELPVVTMVDTLFLVNEDGQWKIDEIPDSPV